MKIHFLLCIALFVGSFSFMTCGSKETENKWKDYAIDSPETFPLPEVLLEISGLILNPENENLVYAIQDEVGVVFTYNLGDKTLKRTKFAKAGDYEDLTILNDQMFVLKSNGELYAFAIRDLQNEETAQTEKVKLDVKKGEYEALSVDRKRNTLLLACKVCKGDNKAIQAFNLKEEDEGWRTEKFEIETHENLGLSRGFAASALAQNPLTGEWFILSSIHKLLVIFDANWQFKQKIHLNKEVFMQPEGIAFDRAGNMFISNEGGDFKAGNILKFKRLKPIN